MQPSVRGLVFLASFALATAADANWSRASSEHFVIYSEQKPDKLRAFAEHLERFDGAVRAVRGMADLPLSKGNRVTIFRLAKVEDVQRLAGDKSGFIAGFYRGSAAGSVAFVSKGEASDAQVVTYTGSNIGYHSANTSLGESTILLHEYSHHLMMQDLDVPYPEWLVEGFAEFMSTAKFESDGSVGIGLPATHRYAGLTLGEQLPLETLLSGHYDKITTEQRESVYGRGWLLTHYLTFEPSRKGQLAAYLRAIAKGSDPLTAARAAFGDLKRLEQELDLYRQRPTLPYLKVKGDSLKVGSIQISPLSQGGSAVVPLLAEVRNGVAASEAQSLAQKVRTVERSYPGDELVETTLAEAELGANHPEAAEAAADRAAQLDPRSTDAMVLKGRAIAARGATADAKLRHALFVQARQIFIAANKLDPEDPEPLMEFYSAFAREGLPPTANAIAALHYASDLAPQDTGLRITSAMQYLSDGKPADARHALIAVAYDPHGGGTARMARAMIDKIDAGDIPGALAVTADYKTTDE